MDKRFTGIVVTASDAGEADRNVRLLTAEEGGVTVKMRGVRRGTARLRFAAQPLALCRYEVAEKAGRYTVTGAEQIEDLGALAADPVAFVAASLVLEAALTASPSVEPGKLFVVTLKALSALTGGTEQNVLIAKFLQKLLSMSGFVRPPERTDAEPVTPTALLGKIAFLTLDEMKGMSFDPAVSRAALRMMVKRYEGVYERKLNSADVFFDMTKN